MLTESHLECRVLYLSNLPVWKPHWKNSTFTSFYGKKKSLEYIYFKKIKIKPSNLSSVQFSSVAQSGLTLFNPMNCSMPGLPVHHQLPASTQTHVHWICDAIQPSHPLSSPSPPALNLSQHQGLLLGIYLEKAIIQKNTCTPVFIAALFTIVRAWKQCKCPLTNEWIRKMWYVYSMKYYSAIKKERNYVLCSDVVGSRVCHTEWSKSEWEKKSYINAYV